MRKKVINHDILIVLIDINPFFHIYIVTTFVTVVVVISNSKFGCLEAAPQELIVDEDEKGDSDIGID